jgi:hypothetical protein
MTPDLRPASGLRAEIANGPLHAERHRRVIPKLNPNPYDIRPPVGAMTQRRGAPAWAPLPSPTLAALVGVLASIILMNCFAARPAAGQTPRDRLEIEIERTDRVLEEAQTVVAAAENERAKNLLGLATRLQATAHETFVYCGERLGACETAARATTGARREAFRAIRVAREQSSYEEDSARLLEQSALLLDEARRLLAENPEPRRERLLDQASTQLERAREQNRIRHFQVSIRLSQNAERLVRQAMDQGGSGELVGERLERELVRTDRLIDRAGALLGDQSPAAARSLLEQARSCQIRSRTAQGGRQPLNALRLTREAQELTEAALRQAEEGADQATVEVALAQTDQLMERIEPAVRASGQPEAVKLLEEAIEHQARAREIGRGKAWGLALAQTRIARNLALDAEIRAGGARDRP